MPRIQVYRFCLSSHRFKPPLQDLEEPNISSPTNSEHWNNTRNLDLEEPNIFSPTNSEHWNDTKNLTLI